MKTRFESPEVLIDHVLRMLDLDEYKRTLDGYKRTLDGGGGGDLKLSSLDMVVPSVKRIFRLGLHETPSVRILDIGCGFGWFPVVCAMLGHEVVGLEPAKPIFAVTDRVLKGFKRVDHVVSVQDFVPPFLLTERFDLIQKSAVNLTDDGKAFRKRPEDAGPSWRPWEDRDYISLATVLIEMLNPGGFMYWWICWDKKGNDKQPVISVDSEFWNGFDTASEANELVFYK